MNNIKKVKYNGIIGSGLLCLLVLNGCVSTTDPYTTEEKKSNTTSKAIWGAVIGAAAGALSQTSDGKEATENAIAGAVVGAAIGAGVGSYMDKQEELIRQELRGTGVAVDRVGDEIKLVMPSSITFDHDKSNVKANFYPVLSSVAKIFDEYNKTSIIVTGHTDSTGKDSYNEALSHRRASNVANYLVAQQVSPARFTIQAMGSSMPIDDNRTAMGRAKNRRVEINILPKDM